MTQVTFVVGGGHVVAVELRQLISDRPRAREESQKHG